MSAVHEDQRASTWDALERFRSTQPPTLASRSLQEIVGTISTPSPTATVPSHTRPAGIGARNTTLAQRAGRWFAKGLDFDEVIQLAQAWNNQIETPLDEEEVCTTVNSISRTHERNHGAVVSAQAPFTLVDCLINRFLESEPPERRWLFKNFIPLGKVGLIVAPGGTGKSTWLLQLAVSVAIGLQLAGWWEVGEPGSVLMLLAEDDDEEIHRRLANILRNLVPEGYAEVYARLAEHLFIRSMVGVPSLLTIKTATGECVQTPLVDSLLELVKGLRDLRLIVIDPASRFRGGIENSAEDTTRFVEALEALAKATGATVLIAHHVSKGGANADEASQHASRGSSALIDGVRWALQLAPPSKKVSLQTPQEFADLKRRTLVATVIKSNYGAIPEPVTLMRGEGGYLRYADSAVWNQIAKRALHRLVLQQLIQSDKTYSKAAFAREHGGASKVFKTGIKQLEAVLTEMVGLGFLGVLQGRGRHLTVSEKGREVAAK
jgi:RecA-family ATPase